MKSKLLLHVCCVTCGGYLVQELSQKYKVTVCFANDNIFPEAEFIKRRDEAKKFFAGLGVDFIQSPYNHSEWLVTVKGLEKEPEKGKRCDVCFEVRLRDVAVIAQKNGFDFFASTLSISPHKNAAIINRIGEKLADEFGLKFLAGDWKKEDGFKKAMVLSRQKNFYRQSYCGCEFPAKK